LENHTAVENRDLPPAVADGFRTALGLDEPPETLGEWVDATARLLDEAGVSIGFDAMCTAESTRHEARVGDDVVQFRCVFDALLLPFVVDDSSPVEIRSRAPGPDAHEAAVVEMTATRENVSADPESAVVSFGVAADAASVSERDDPLAYGHEAFCPYINAFPDEAAYEEWAADTPEAETMSLPAADAHALARKLATA
jgi:hypothetical protein